MPPKRLIEQVVQENAQKYLEQYYRIQYGIKKMYSKLEERTKKKYGMKRADGLLAFKRRGGLYVVSMEAKSHKTLPALRPYRVNKLWRRDSIWKGFLGTLMCGVLFFVWRGEGVWMRLVLPFGVWGALAGIHAFIFRKSYKYQEMEVVHQVFQYPANEQWLSLSTDSFMMIKEDVRRNLFKICEARGIGVLMVEPDLSVSLIHKPQKHISWFGTFLKYYLYENDIKEFLGFKTKAAETKTASKKKSTSSKKKTSSRSTSSKSKTKKAPAKKTTAKKTTTKKSTKRKGK